MKYIVLILTIGLFSCKQNLSPPKETYEIEEVIRVCPKNQKVCSDKVFRQLDKSRVAR